MATSGMLMAATAASAQAATSFTTSPTLYPTFMSSISDYVVPCTNSSPVQVNVTATNGDQVSVDGQTAQTGSFSANVSVTTGQEFAVVSTHGSKSSTWYVRCLPTDFPPFTSPVNASTDPAGSKPQAKYYLTTPLENASFSANPLATNYVAIFDDNGVPVWWKAVPTVPVFATTMNNGNIEFTNRDTSGGNTLSGTPNPAEVVGLNGSLVRTISDPNGNVIDFHDIQKLYNGDDLIMVDTSRCCYDFSSWGTTAKGNSAGPGSTIYDQVIEAVNPSTHHVDWSWDPADHIDPVAQTGSNFRATALDGGSPYDVFHMNSFATNGSDVIVSFRHLNAVYDINKSSGNIVWKLGGNPETQNGSSVNLTVSGDSYYGSTPQYLFCGQHDARVVDPNGLLSDSGATLSVHDNGTLCGPGGSTPNRTPRAVRFSIDPSTMTATEVESITDPLVTSSICCGSARKLPGGDWVLSWGHQQFFTELTATGTRVYQVSWTGTGSQYGQGFSYRVKPILPGFYTMNLLRNGMNTQYPRS